MAAPISVVGIGPGASEYLTPLALEEIKGADILVGGERLLASFKEMDKKTFTIKNNLAEMIEFINLHKDKERVAVLASGDPGMYGILSFLKKHYNNKELKVIPGISSIQIACAKLSLPWHDAIIGSTHGRGLDNLLEISPKHSKIVLLTDNIYTPAVIAQFLIDKGIGHTYAAFCANISYPDEVIVRGTLADMVAKGKVNNSVMVVSDEEL